MKLTGKSPLCLVPLYYVMYFVWNPADWMFGDAGNIFAKVTVSSYRFALDRYSNWSSRLWIEGATVFATHHIAWFVVISLGALLLMVFSLSYACGFETFESNLLLALCIVGLFPINSLASAGWIATTVNYLWPLAFFIFWLSIFIRRYVNSSSLPIRMTALLCLALSVFSEVLAVAAACCLLLEVIIHRRKCVSWFFGFSTLITIAGMLNVLLCPGNAIRKTREISNWFPQFEEFNIVDRVVIQSVHLATSVLETYGNLLTVFIIILACLSMVQGRKFLALLLMMVLMIFTLLGPKAQVDFQTISDLVHRSQLSHQQIVSIYPMALVFVGSLVLIVVTAASLFGLTEATVAVSVPLTISSVIGLAASMSPTLIDSGDRPFIPMYLAIATCSALVAEKLVTVAKSAVDLSTRPVGTC
ncbi:MAG: hypothetical protein GXW98_08990 [Bifidobacterium crudilactis]|uniref:Uncharacterized protein n=1 Tax=Bifidobacterium crudilactis TaxID=327277 RepID=A0A971D093_9BIFI|nr:hypothetical protein [Bifidobacterium crudilactis]MCI1217230.1 hypothetical protein [Bifidobacterium crudilactis]NLT80399.1 hypothetical protein [Bifidobacterium crudilactis]